MIEFDAIRQQDAIIQRDADVLGGTPVFVGTHVPIETLIHHLTEGETLETFLDGYPSVSRKQAESYLYLALETSLAQPLPQKRRDYRSLFRLPVGVPKPGRALRAVLCVFLLTLVAYVGLPDRLELTPPVYPEDDYISFVYMPYQPGDIEHMMYVGDILVHFHLHRTFEYVPELNPFPFLAYAGPGFDICQIGLLWLPHHLDEPDLMAWLILHEYGHCVDRLKLGYDHNGLTDGNSYTPDYPAPERYANAYANLWLERHKAMHGQDSVPVTWNRFEDGISVIDISAMPDPREICRVVCVEDSAPYSMPEGYTLH